MNLLEQKIRKQMIDESIKDKISDLGDMATLGLGIGKAKLSSGFGRAADSRVGRFVIGQGKKAATGFMDPEGKGGGLSARAGRLARVGGRKIKTNAPGAAENVVDTLFSGARAGAAAAIHAGVGRLSDLATQGFGGGDDRVGPTNTPMGSKADVARGSADVKKAFNPLRSLERTAAEKEVEDVKTALKKLGDKEASAFAKKQAEIRSGADEKIKDIQTNVTDKVQQKAEIQQVIRDRQDELKQFDTTTIAKAVAKQRRGVRSQIAALAGGETEAEKAAQFLKYLRGRDRDR